LPALAPSTWRRCAVAADRRSFSSCCQRQLRKAPASCSTTLGTLQARVPGTAGHWVPWLLEETGRWERLPRSQRICPHCSGGIEDVEHVIFHCPLYASLRQRFADLYASNPSPCSLHAFFQQAAPRLASFASALFRAWQEASASPPHDTPLTHTTPSTHGHLHPTPHHSHLHTHP